VLGSQKDPSLAFYQSKPDEAKALLAVGETKANAKLDPSAFHPPWTMVPANEMMNSRPKCLTSRSGFHGLRNQFRAAYEAVCECIIP